MTLQTDQTLSHYRLIEKIGEGGMGVVWKAEDTVLKRTVAIKVLPADVVYSEDRRKRFLEEARAASAVSDAHIVQVYEFGQERGLDFIVMEYVEGNPLNKLLHGRPLPSHKVADYGQQVARALSRAHRKKLLHRDLKPGNILVTAEGEVKVVDFGLAILFRHAGSTATTRSILEGDPTGKREIAGTLPYMSPEQVRGEELDARSDIFSLGTVLYEMTTGQQPFGGRTTRDLVGEIIKARPNPVHELVPNTPMELERIIDKALAPRRADRYQTTDDLAVDLKRLGRDLESGSAPSWGSLVVPASEKQRRPRLWAGLGVLAVIALGWTMWQLWPWQSDTASPTSKAGTRVAPVYRQITFTGNAVTAEISPDGLSVAYVEEAEHQGVKLMVRDLAGGESLEILKAFSIYHMRWSPEGTELLVPTLEGPQEKVIYLVPRLGGTPRRIPLNGYYFSWSPDGLSYASAWMSSKGITIYEKSTGATSSVPLEGSFTWLRDIDWSPTGNFLAFLTSDEEERYAISIIPPEGGTQRQLVEENDTIFNLRWSRDGAAIYYLVSRQDTSALLRIRIDPNTGKAASSPAAILTGLETGGLSLARDRNRLVYAKQTRYRNLWLVTLREAAEGKPVETMQLTSGTVRDNRPSVSPDGGQVAFVRGGNIWTMPLEGGPPRQLTFTESSKGNPAWSPDGSWIAFGSDEEGTPRVWKIAAQGGSPRPFEKTKLSGDSQMVEWAPGSRILYHRPGNRNFHLLDPDTEEETPLVKDDSVGWVLGAKYSPDGTRVAVGWNRTQPEGDFRMNLWTISLTDSSEVGVSGSRARPRGWSGDEAWIYAWDFTASRAIKIPATGGEAETVFEWPFEGKDGWCEMGSDESQWVCTVGESSSDIWLVENFDPDLN